MTNGAALHSTFERAIAQHRAGQLADAAALYHEVLRHDAEHEQARFLSAAIAIELGRLDQAVEALERLLARAPGNAVYWTNLGEAHRRAGDDERAAHALVQAVRLKPDLAQAHFNLGLVTRRLGEHAAALQAFERATDLKPDDAQLQHGLASMLLGSGEYARAIGRFQCALVRSPTSARLLIDYACCLRNSRRFEAALVAVKRALELEPQSALALHEQSASLVELGRFDEAVQSSERAVTIEPGSAAALTGLAAALADSGRLDEAIAAYRKAVALDPKDHLAHSNLVYLTSFQEDATAQAILDEARAWARRHETPFTPHARPHTNDASPARKLRLGYVSSNLNQHALTLFLSPLLGAHDRSGFELYAYASLTRADAVTARLRPQFDQWHDISRLEPQAAAELIRSHGIDVLVDLTMHMSVSLLRVFACKPAPVQIAWLAYPGTTGLAAMDYRITDRHLDPPDSSAQPYAEASLVLPDSFWCYDPGSDAPPVSELPATTNGYVTFGCLNAFWKLNASTLQRFARVLERVPRSRLLLLAPEGSARARLLGVFEGAGIEPERIEFASRRPRTEYLRLYQRIDVCLDTLPYNGHTTNLDAFYMGVPVITLVGDTVVGRAGLCHAANLNLPQLVAQSDAELLDTAAALVADLSALAELRASLRQRLSSSPLMDAPRFARNLEGKYREAWERWCEAVRA